MLQFIPDHQLPDLIRESDLLVLPYDLKSSLNSGTVVLAFSYKKTVICPEIGTISDLNQSKKYVLSYKYLSPLEHREKLTEMILRAVEMKRNNPEIFTNWGNKMFEYIQNNHNKELVTNKLLGIYQAVLGKKDLNLSPDQ